MGGFSPLPYISSQKALHFIHQYNNMIAANGAADRFGRLLVVFV